MHFSPVKQYRSGILVQFVWHSCAGLCFCRVFYYVIQNLTNEVWDITFLNWLFLLPSGFGIKIQQFNTRMQSYIQISKNISLSFALLLFSLFMIIVYRHLWSGWFHKLWRHEIRCKLQIFLIFKHNLFAWTCPAPAIMISVYEFRLRNLMTLSSKIHGQKPISG